MCEKETASEATRCSEIMMETQNESPRKNRWRGKREKCGVCMRKREKTASETDRRK